MANYDEYTCYTCGQVFKYCRRCVINPIRYKEEGFCSPKCSDIFSTLSKHGCNLITADEAFADLTMYNVDENKLADNIAAHIERIKSEVTIQVEYTAEQSETVSTFEQSEQ